MDDVVRALLPVGAGPDALRTAARQALDLAERATDAAARARSAGDVDWRSAAAEQFRSRLDGCTREVAACAAGLEDAAVHLTRCAETVRDRLALLSAGGREGAA